MSFFGLTMLGGTSGSVFERLNARILQFHEIDDDHFAEAFYKYSIQEGTSLSRTLGLTGLSPSVILRESLPLVLSFILAREATPAEKFAFDSFMVLDNAATIAFEAYMKAVGALKQRSLSEARPEYLSNKKLLEDRHRHVRTEKDLQLTLTKPITGNQEFGWRHKASLGQPREFYGLLSTDVTKKEGRSLADYYM